MYTPSLNSIVWISFQITVGNHHFDPLWVNFWTREGQNLVNVVQAQISSEHLFSKCTPNYELDCVNTFSDNGRKSPIWPVFVSTRGLAFGQRRQKGNQFWFIQQMHTPKFEINWVITFSDNGRKPRMDGHTHRRLAGHSLFLCPLPTSSAWTQHFVS